MKINFLLLLIIIPLSSKADVSSEVQRLKKCYGLFVKERIQPSHPLLEQVKTGKLSGTEACMSVLDKGTIQDDGEIKKDNDGKHDYEGLKVLKSFTELHRSFFMVPSFLDALGEGEGKTIDITDVNEPSYHFTYTLLKPDEKFSSISTRNHSFFGIRYTQNAPRTIHLLSKTPLEFKVFNTAWNPRLVQTGILVGIKPMDEPNPINGLEHNHKPFNGTDVNQHYGAGVIGSQAYLLGNNGSLFSGVFNDGGIKIYRRWSQHVLSDLLCRDLPALRSSDVTPANRPGEYVPESDLSFRRGISCMGCHSSMDPMAGVLRNFSPITTSSAHLVRLMIYKPPGLSSAPYPVLKGDEGFSARPPEGRLLYRSYDGSLVEANVNNLQELGEEIANTNDLYVCAAKRYFEFLTGISVGLYDPGNINSPKLNETEQFYREKVIKLGIELKEDGVLKNLIRNIIDSPTFIHPDKGL